MKLHHYITTVAVEDLLRLKLKIASVMTVFIHKEVVMAVLIIMGKTPRSCI